MFDGRLDRRWTPGVQPQLVGLEAGAALAPDRAVDVGQAAAVDVRGSAAVTVDGGEGGGRVVDEAAVTIERHAGGPAVPADEEISSTPSPSKSSAMAP